MPHLERIIKELSRQKMTPQFKNRVNQDIARGYSRALRGAEAVGQINLQLTDEENRLADLFEQSLGAEGEPACRVPGARAAFEKRSTLLEAAIQKESDGSQI